MKKPQVQNAISLESFRILKSDFNVTEDIDGSILENLKIEFKFATGFSHEQSKRFVVKFIISIQHNDDSAFKLNVESQTTFTSLLALVSVMDLQAYTHSANRRISFTSNLRCRT